MVDTANRAEELALYIVKNNATVRAAAKAFGVSKSTVHTDITEKLQNVNSDLWHEVRKVLDINKAQRHLRGGQATKEKYLREKK
ncbi:MAG: sporulation transcriptional regulator SpoIIID [Clostridia bacterium]|nr:sporulation transcriptional regulator SpoIIID [Clostridia bacterium]MBQ9507233.1 sporulation transcriptional regulator SpoIIID [Clostridia bacterium]MBR5423014.1 sporulation transcriptional regulator SpoIIID [Clostridia bacterium]